MVLVIAAILHQHFRFQLIGEHLPRVERSIATEDMVSIRV